MLFNQRVMNILIKFTKQAAILIIFLVISGCGIYKKVDARKVPVNVNDRAAKNIEEGRSFKLFDPKNTRGGDFQFSSSNELWKASLDVIDFMPLSSVNYSGGIIITDWFNDVSQTENIRDIKITIKFLSNEIRADGLQVDVHERICKKNNSNSCKINKIKSKISSELKLAILKKASRLENEIITKNIKKNKRVLPSKDKR